MPPAGSEHSEIVMLVGFFLLQYVRERSAGIITGADGGFILSEDPPTVLVPDVAFVRAERLSAEVDRSKILPFEPDLAIEIVSPTDRSTDVTNKTQIYLDHGTQQVWIVHPEHKLVTVHLPDGVARTYKEHDTIPGGDLLPGFELPVAEIFRSPVSGPDTE